jgi:hypothetical protein
MLNLYFKKYYNTGKHVVTVAEEVICWRMRLTLDITDFEWNA